MPEMKRKKENADLKERKKQKQKTTKNPKGFLLHKSTNQTLA